LALLFRLEPVGGRRRAVRDAAGATAFTCAFVGPAGLAVDVLDGGESLAARIRGGAMPVPDFHVNLVAGERLRVYADGARLAVESDRRARAATLVAEEAGGWRGLTFEDSRGIAGVLRMKPLDGSEPWLLDVPSFGDPLRALAVLVAAERFLREREFPPRGT
jgi:hypothetical protein